MPRKAATKIKPKAFRPKPPPIPAPPGTIRFNAKEVVRYTLDGGVPFFCADDVFRIARRSMPEEAFEGWAPEHYGFRLFGEEDRVELLPAVSCIGVQTIGAQAADYMTPRIIGNWARKVTSELLTPAGAEAIVVPFELLADGTPPPSPGGNSYRWAEWYAVKAKHDLDHGVLAEVRRMKAERAAAGAVIDINGNPI